MEKINSEYTTLTREKVRWTIKRLSYILNIKNKGINKATFYIGKQKEEIVIDDEVLAVIDIIAEVIDYEEKDWLKKLFIMLRKGYRDVYILLEMPMERSKYYLTKERLVNKVYQCCIYKGMVEYEEILREDIG